jgi:hypothetical protein
MILDYRRVCPKRLLSLWYFWCKPCTNRESRWTLFPNGLKWASKRTEMSFHLSLVGVPSGASKMISDPMVRLSKPCTYLARTLTPSSNGPKQDLTWPTSPRGPSGASKMILKSMVCSAQCVNISTISKESKTSFHLSLVNLEYYRVRPKWFLTAWYIWHKPCTYLAQTLTPSWNRPK